MMSFQGSQLCYFTVQLASMHEALDKAMQDRNSGLNIKDLMSSPEETKVYTYKSICRRENLVSAVRGMGRRSHILQGGRNIFKKELA